MGIMACSKRDCDNIMCNKYTKEIGYIYYDCLEELRLIQKIKPKMNLKDIKNWVDIPKDNNINKNYTQPMINLDKLFENI